MNLKNDDASPSLSPVTETLTKTFKVLAINSILDYRKDDKIDISLGSGESIFECSDASFYIPIAHAGMFYDNYRSSLKDSYVDFEKLSRLIYELGYNDSIVRLNHIGICYKVNSQVEERVRLTNDVRLTKLNLYEEPSNDMGLWLFVGNTTTWNDPLLELLPVQDLSDKWVDYWLPHFQIDIDTKWSDVEIEQKVNSIYQGEIKPFRVTVIDEIVYCIRVRLGIVSGININLDIATNKRDVEYLRTKIVRKLN